MFQPSCHSWKNANPPNRCKLPKIMRVWPAERNKKRSMWDGHEIYGIPFSLEKLYQSHRKLSFNRPIDMMLNMGRDFIYWINIQRRTDVKFSLSSMSFVLSISPRLCCADYSFLKSFALAITNPVYNFYKPKMIFCCRRHTNYFILCLARMHMACVCVCVCYNIVHTQHTHTVRMPSTQHTFTYNIVHMAQWGPASGTEPGSQPAIQQRPI